MDRTVFTPHRMYQFNTKPIIKLNKLQMHSVSRVQIPNNLTNFTLLQPHVRLKKLQLCSATSINIPSTSINKCFYNGPKVVLSPLKYSIHSNISRSLNPFYRHRVYPSIRQCNAKNCKCCNYISCASTIKSNVNRRTFTVQLYTDID